MILATDSNMKIFFHKGFCLREFAEKGGRFTFDVGFSQPGSRDDSCVCSGLVTFDKKRIFDATMGIIT